MLTQSKSWSNKSCSNIKIEFYCETHDEAYCLNCIINFHSDCSHMRLGSYENVRRIVESLEERIKRIRHFVNLYQIGSYCVGFNAKLQDFEDKIQRFKGRFMAAIKATKADQVVWADVLEGSGLALIKDIIKSQMYIDFWVTKENCESYGGEDMKVDGICEKCKEVVERMNQVLEKTKKKLQNSDAEIAKERKKCRELKEVIDKLEEEVKEFK